MPYQRNSWLIVLLLNGLWFHLSWTAPDAAYQNHTTSILISEKNGWLIEAVDITLKQFLNNIHNRFGITVSGLEKRETEIVNVQMRGKTLEVVLKGFLRHLGGKATMLLNIRKRN